jgi:hypothetical protein
METWKSVTVLYLNSKSLTLTSDKLETQQRFLKLLNRTLDIFLEYHKILKQQLYT